MDVRTRMCCEQSRAQSHVVCACASDRMSQKRAYTRGNDIFIAFEQCGLASWNAHACTPPLGCFRDSKFHININWRSRYVLIWPVVSHHNRRSFEHVRLRHPARVRLTWIRNCWCVWMCHLVDGLLAASRWKCAAVECVACMLMTVSVSVMLIDGIWNTHQHRCKFELLFRHNL